MCANNTPAGLSVLAKCTTDVRQWYLQNGLQLNPDKSEALIVGTTNQLRAVTSSVSVAGVDLPVSDDIKVLAVMLDQHLILSRIDYCNAVLHGAPSYSIKKLQRVQNNAARIVLEAPIRSHISPLLRTLHWLHIQQRIDYKVALLTFEVHSTSTPSYLRLLIRDQEHGHNLRSTTMALRQPFTTTTFAKHAFRCSAPAVWNSLPKTVLNSNSLAVFKSRLKTFLFSQAFPSISAH